jgi:hypothetical protein
MKLAFRFALGLALIAAVARAGEPQSSEPQAAASHERFICTFGAAERLIDIYRLGHGPQAGRCRVEYTKNGMTRSLWSSNSDYAYCVRQAVGLVTKLSKGHFSCKPRTVEPAGKEAPP